MIPTRNVRVRGHHLHGDGMRARVHKKGAPRNVMNEMFACRSSDEREGGRRHRINNAFLTSGLNAIEKKQKWIVKSILATRSMPFSLPPPPSFRPSASLLRYCELSIQMHKYHNSLPLIISSHKTTINAWARGWRLPASSTGEWESYCIIMTRNYPLFLLHVVPRVLFSWFGPTIHRVER